MKNRFRNSIILFILLGCVTVVFSQEATVKAKIVSKVVDNLIDIKAIAINTDATYKDEYSYLLFSLKKGKEGNYNRNSQSGEFSLAPNEEKELSSLKINIEKNEECKVYLFIRKYGTLISKDSTVIYAAERTAEKEENNTDNIVLKGIVVESMLTKVGKDYYDYFYQGYLNSGNQYPFIIEIKERPYFGRSSIITLEVEDQKIFEFYSKPDEDYLKSAVTQALQNLSAYDKQRKMLFKNARI